MSFADLYRRGEPRSVFEHATVHERLVSGPGTDTNTALAPVAERIAAEVDQADAHLRRLLRDSDGIWHGRGADLAPGATPLSRAVRALRMVSEEIERRVARQAKEFARVATMPEPLPVEPIALGGAETPWSFLDAQSDKEWSERAATAAEETARRQYERYRANVVPDSGPLPRGASVPSPRAR